MGFQPGSAYFPFLSESPTLGFFFLGFLEGGGSAGPVFPDCSDSSACDCDAWDCLLLTLSISASSFSPSSFFFGCPFFIIILSFQNLSDIHFDWKKLLLVDLFLFNASRSTQPHC